jgi:hypothetical protein
VVGLEVGLFARDDLVAVEIAVVDDVESVSDLTLNDHILVGLGLDFLHGVDDDVEVFLVEVAEEDALFDESGYFLFGGCVFGDHLGLEGPFLVELSEHLSTDALPTVLLLQFLFLLFFDLLQKGGLGFLALLLRIRVQVSVVVVAWMDRNLLMSLKEYSLMKEGMLEGRLRTIS